jgi:spore coat protein U-like protein
MKILLRKLQHAVLVLIALTSLPVCAQTTLTSTAVMPVRMEIVAACEVSVSDLDFGGYTSGSATSVLSQTNIQLTCGAGTTAEIALDAGAAPGRDTSRRKMVQDRGIDRMDYNLFQDAGRRVHWGDRSGVDTMQVGTTGQQQSIPIYGEIPANQRVREGIYSDVITVSVYY